MRMGKLLYKQEQVVFQFHCIRPIGPTSVDCANAHHAVPENSQHCSSGTTPFDVTVLDSSIPIQQTMQKEPYVTIEASVFSHGVCTSHVALNTVRLHA